jgi:hypothetical protein
MGRNGGHHMPIPMGDGVSVVAGSVGERMREREEERRLRCF